MSFAIARILFLTRKVRSINVNYRLSKKYEFILFLTIVISVATNPIKLLEIVSAETRIYTESIKDKSRSRSL